MSSVTPQQSDSNHQPYLVISAHDDIIWRLAYLPNGRRVVTGSGDRTVKVWDLENGEQEGTSMEHERGIFGLAVTRDGTKIISSDYDGKIKVWNVETHKLVKEWSYPSYPGSCPRIAISPDDRLIAVANEILAIYCMEGNLRKVNHINHSIEAGNRVQFMCFSPDGTKLACSTLDDIRVYDVNDGTLVLGPLRGHQHWIWGVLWSHDGSRLFSGSDDKTIRCWNTHTGEQIGHPWTGHTSYIRSLSLSPDGSILASASLDHTVRFWDATTGKPIGQYDNTVSPVCFSPCGDSVASAGSDGKIYFWRVPRLNSITHQAITSPRCTSVFTLIAFAI